MKLLKLEVGENKIKQILPHTPVKIFPESNMIILTKHRIVLTQENLLLNVGNNNQQQMPMIKKN